MKVYLPNYKYREPFDPDDCKDCKYNLGGRSVMCTNENAAKYIGGNMKCGVYARREQEEEE